MTTLAFGRHTQLQYNIDNALSASYTALCYCGSCESYYFFICNQQIHYRYALWVFQFMTCHPLTPGLVTYSLHHRCYGDWNNGNLHATLNVLP